MPRQLLLQIVTVGCPFFCFLFFVFFWKKNLTTHQSLECAYSLCIASVRMYGKEYENLHWLDLLRRPPPWWKNMSCPLNRPPCMIQLEWQNWFKTWLVYARYAYKWTHSPYINVFGTNDGCYRPQTSWTTVACKINNWGRRWHEEFHLSLSVSLFEVGCRCTTARRLFN